MKKWGMMLLALALLAGMTAARADSMDFAPYALEYGAAYASAMLNEHDLVGERSALDGLVWWRDRAVYRTFHMEQGMGNYLLLPRSDGTCGAVHISKEEDTSRRKVVLYDWEEEGLVNGREIPVTRPVRYDVVKDGMALLDDNGSQTLLKLYDGYGNLEAQIEVSREIDFVIGSVRVGPGWWLTEVSPWMKTDGYILLMIRDGAVVWQKGPGKENPWVFPDGQGGFFLCAAQDESTYKPLVITRYDGNGNQLWRKTLKGNKVVLGAVISIDPETGHTVLTGTAMANSRKVYRVYRMEVDDQGKTISMDVRESNYHNSIYYSVHVSPDTGNIWVLFDKSIYYADPYPAALVPFDALPKADNPGIELR